MKLISKYGSVRKEFPCSAHYLIIEDKLYVAYGIMFFRYVIECKTQNIISNLNELEIEKLIVFFNTCLENNAKYKNYEYSIKESPFEDQKYLKLYKLYKLYMLKNK